MGKTLPPGGKHRQRRFTPTRVGKTCETWPQEHLTTVHPHAGGENVFRGVADVRVSRFTPTRVGKTNIATVGRVVFAVHPHAGGENFQLRAYLQVGIGSPPRGWGKPKVEQANLSSTRFTPTRVGKTVVEDLRPCGALGSPPRGWGKLPTSPHPSLTQTVHPHAGGENLGGDFLSLGYHGSPPRGWGKRIEVIEDGSLFGSPPRGWGKLTP